MTKKLLIKNQDNLPNLIEEIPENGIITVGSDPSATISLNGGVVAPEQFVIVCDSNGTTLMCRANGGSLNGSAISQGTIHNLAAGDTIIIDGYTLIFDAREHANPLSETQDRSNSSEIISEEIQQFSEPNLQEAETVLPMPNKSPTEVGYEGSLKDVLAGLRAEEKFYFLFENEAGLKRKNYVEAEEMWLGWNSFGECIVSKTKDEILIPRAEIRKDWSGVVLHPLSKNFIKINGKPTEDAHRLKNDDDLLVLNKEGNYFSPNQSIKFHEPTALLVLDSILPKELPPPVSLDFQNNPADAPETIQDNASLLERGKPAATVRSKLKNKLFFGYFTFTEILLMAIGTLITAILIFLVLEFY